MVPRAATGMDLAAYTQERLWWPAGIESDAHWLLDGSDGDDLALGIYGQAIDVNPATDIVIVQTSAYPDYNIDGSAMELESIAFFRAIARSLR